MVSRLNPFSFQKDGLASAEVDGGRCQVLQAFMVTPVIVVLDEAHDLGFEITGQVIVLEQNVVLLHKLQVSSSTQA
jgi:hypothetical protein